MSRTNKIKQNLFALALGFFLAFILTEATIRLFPRNYSHLYEESTVYFKSDKDLGFIALPNQKATHMNSCFKIYPIKTNTYGFRDGPWQKGRDFNIAILGDSFMMAQEIPEDNYLSAVMQSLLGREVLNGGMPGCSTLYQHIVYRKFLKPFNPDIVILFFHLGSDVAENSCELCEYLWFHIDRPCSFLKEGKLIPATDFRFSRKSALPEPKSPLRKFLKKYCLGCVIANRFIHNRLLYRILYPIKEEDQLEAHAVYIPEKNKAWEEAWEITEKAIVDLRDEVEADGAEFIVVVIPSHLMTTKSLGRELKRDRGLKQIPVGFNLSYPPRKFREICQRQAIRLFEPLPYFIDYREKFDLDYPYFAYRCDGHWNPLGHFLASHLVSEYLVKNNLIPLNEQERQKILNRIEKNIDLSPREILGEVAYKQIYRRGVYRGESNIASILKRE